MEFLLVNPNLTMILGFLGRVVTFSKPQKSMLPSWMPLGDWQALLKFLIANCRSSLINKFIRIDSFSFLSWSSTRKCITRRIHIMKTLMWGFLRLKEVAMIAGWLARKPILFPARLTLNAQSVFNTACTFNNIPGPIIWFFLAFS
jgi:hypothetical protein